MRTRDQENFFDQSRAAISRDGKYILFDSTMAYLNGCPASIVVGAARARTLI